MTGWNIDPAAARGVCVSTQNAGAGLDTIAFAISDAFASASGPVGSDTAAALKNVATDPLLMRISSMRRMVTFVTETVGSVISSYEAGDLTMAAQSQSDLKGLDL